MYEVFFESLGVLAAVDATAVPDGGERFLRFLGRLHPLIVHFPIGLAITAAFVELINIIRRKPTASQFAFMATGFAAVSAVLAAIFGWFYADFEGAGPKTALFLHRWIGTVAAGALVVVFFCGLAGRTGRRISALNGYRWGLVISAILVTVGSHFGGEMVYGEGYFTKVLFPPAAKSTTPEATTPDPSTPQETSSSDATATKPVSFKTQVLPIFEARCVDCHGADKAKGDLRLDSAAEIFGEDPSWWVVEPGDAAKSILVERIVLPAGHVDLMPPKGDPLDEGQIVLISDWINQGARYEVDGKMVDPAQEEPVSQDTAEESTANEASSASETKASEAESDPAREKAVTSLRERGVIVMPVAQDTTDWELNASFANPPFDDAAIALMDGLESVLVSLNLSRTKVNDAGLAKLAGFQKITSLRLDNTVVGDGGMEALLKLENIEMLNLYGTQVTDSGVATVAALPNLKRLYCAGTKTTAEGVEALQAKYPKMEIVGPTPPAEAAAPEQGEAAKTDN